MTPLYGYAPKGQRAVGRVPKNRGENTTLIAALSLAEGVTAAMTLSGAVDGVAFETYIKKLLCPKLRPGQVVVMGQLEISKSSEVRKAIRTRGCKLVFLPSYSPDLNLNEQAFAKLKAFVKRAAARTRAALDAAIGTALKTVALSDVRGWFEHAGYSLRSL